MQVSSLTIIESLKGKLLEFPALVDSLNKREFNFLALLETWMKETERILKDYSMSECAVIAGYRSKLLAPLFAEPQKRSTKKQQWQLASALLFDLQETVVKVIRPYEMKVNEARDLMVQLLGIVQQSGAIHYTDQTNFQEFISSIWQLCSTNDQLKPGAAKILTLVSRIDALRIIAAAIEPEEWR